MPGATRPKRSLNPRERECLELLGRGLTYKQIAQRLGVAHSTIRTHLQNTYAKLGVANAAQAVGKFQRLDWAMEMEAELRELQGRLTSARLLNRAFDALLEGNADAAVALRVASRATLREHGLEAREVDKTRDELLDEMLMAFGVLPGGRAYSRSRS